MARELKVNSNVDPVSACETKLAGCRRRSSPTTLARALPCWLRPTAQQRSRAFTALAKSCM